MAQYLLSRFLPCDKPQVPHMKLLCQRVESFCSWPHPSSKPPKQHMAEAGFFYEGKEDKTRCFYCNGQLRQWEHDDDPWTEHAKWFSGCEYLLRRMGQGFVRAVTDAYPKLNQPAIPNSVDHLWKPTVDPEPQQNPANNYRSTSAGILSTRQGCISPGVPRLIPGQVGRTESDALPIVHTTTSDAEQEPSTYVFNPDVTIENNRLASFRKCPYRITAMTMRFAAKNGFHYTGRADIASCFSCGRAWSITRTAYSGHIHVRDCRMKNQLSTENNASQQPMATSGVDPDPRDTTGEKRHSSSEPPRNHPQTP